jgi:conjugal transfer/type IV secretion protein DotA/TraY
MFGISPPNTDYFMNTLASILGPIVPHVTGIGGNDGLADTATAMSVVLGYFNTIALFVAVAWILYIGFVGMLKTAHEGEWIGQKWSTLWVPLRIAIAAALVLPVFPAGNTGTSYSAIQAIVVWVEGNAVGMADKAWDLTAQYIVKDPIGGVTLNPAHTQKIADDIFESEVCMYAANHSINHSTFSGEVGKNPIVETTNTHTDLGQDFQQGVNFLQNVGDWVWDGKKYHPEDINYQQDQWNVTGAVPNLLNILQVPVTVCGGITYPTGSTGSNTASKIDNAVWNASSAQIAQMVTAMQPLAQAMVYDRQNPSIAAYKKIVQDYENNTIQNAMNGIATAEKPAEQKFLNGVKTQGFATAGVWWWELTHLNQIAQHAMNAVGTTRLWSLRGMVENTILGAKFSRSMHRSAEFLLEYNQATQQGPSGAPESGIPQRGGISGAITWFDKYLGSILLWMGDEPRNKNPILGVEHIGTMIETGAGAVLWGPTVVAGIRDVLFVTAVAQGGVDVPDDAAAAGSAVVAHMAHNLAKHLGVLGDLIFFGLFGLGVIMTVWIPMLPFIIWTFALFGLLIFFIEAVFAAPFWAISHMNPDGHEVVGSGGRGWMMILQVLLKPVLMIGGLLAGTAILYAGAWLVQNTIGGAIISTFENSAGGFVGMFDAIGELIIYVFILIVLIDLSFGLIHKLPDLVFAWIGGGSTERGEGEMKGKEDSMRGKSSGKMNKLVGGQED